MVHKQKSLYELGMILVSLHRSGYVAAEGYSFAERDDQFGKGSISVHAVAVAAPPKEGTPTIFCREWWQKKSNAKSLSPEDGKS